MEHFKCPKMSQNVPEKKDSCNSGVISDVLIQLGMLCGILTERIPPEAISYPRSASASHIKRTGARHSLQ